MVQRGALLEKFVTWWALSGAAVLLERVTEKPFELEITEKKEEEPERELLRTEPDEGLALEIEYSGGRTVTVTGGVTGKSYVFSGLRRLGAVDPRDAMTILRDGRFRLKRVIQPKHNN